MEKETAEALNSLSGHSPGPCSSIVIGWLSDKMFPGRWNTFYSVVSSSCVSWSSRKQGLHLDWAKPYFVEKLPAVSHAPSVCSERQRQSSLRPVPPSPRCPSHPSVLSSLNRIIRAFDTPSCIFRVGNILFSVETQTTEERTQLYHAEIDALYKDLTAKGKVLILSSEFGVGFRLSSFYPCFFWFLCTLLKAFTLSLGLHSLCLKSALIER